MGVSYTDQAIAQIFAKHGEIVKLTAPSSEQIANKGFYDFSEAFTAIPTVNIEKIDSLINSILNPEQLKELKELRKQCFKYDTPHSGIDTETVTRKTFAEQDVETFSGFHAYHGLVGLVEEVKELHEAVVKQDKINILEESGDILWFLGQVLRAEGLTILQALEANTKKLTKRYETIHGVGFSENSFDNRNIAQEMAAVESVAQSK